ncbi:glycoside hydrolase family 5 protein [Pseudomonas rhizoryzae]|uniref:glycoside hydrolase family 5 protein n=1 Tax=Pseudomonas rhizoryzae TaxID=2571129 RepID=UPI0007377F95|nr:glycoside hydrolase family 5 protein [Pseudomonas rhizoryzae]KTT22744.1 cellulase [Pseudomonas psychrotolerans]KTT37973.1 cellulase [Pseudomonas psychrotolerans]KTT73978.1 cellulase [Pseudomonas psychrotolerans]
MTPIRLSLAALRRPLAAAAAVLALSAGAAQAEPVSLVGLNLSGAGFAPQVLPGINGTNYIFPVEAYFQQWSARGVKLIRFPIIWERLQPKLGGPLDSAYVALVNQTFGYAQKHGIKIILDLHNYARYRGQVIGTSGVSYARYQEIMTHIARQWSGQSSLYAYDIMNEPHDAMAYWPTAAQYGINGVRAVDSTRPVIVEGNGWSSATRWAEFNDALLGLKDPANNIIFSAHSYFDENAGGSYDKTDVNKLDANYGVTRVKPFVDWLKKNGKRGYIGEFGVPDNNPRWNLLMDNMLAYLKQNCIPASYWAAGPGWGSYFMSVEPINGQERPQWPTLRKYLDDSSCTAIGPIASGSTTPSTGNSGTGSSGSTGGNAGAVGNTGSSNGGSSSNTGSSGSNAGVEVPATGGATAGTVTSVLNDFTNADWLKGVYRNKAAVSVPGTAVNRAAFKAGAYLTTADGQVRRISFVQAGNNLGVFTEGAALNGNAMGYPKTVTVSPTGVSSAASVSSAINDFTNADWNRGVYRRAAAISIPATDANRSAFKLGGSVRLANGQVAKISYVQDGAKNLGVFLDASRLDASVGYPNTLVSFSR